MTKKTTPITPQHQQSRLPHEAQALPTVASSENRQKIEDHSPRWLLNNIRSCGTEEGTALLYILEYSRVNQQGALLDFYNYLKRSTMIRYPDISADEVVKAYTKD